METKYIIVARDSINASNPAEISDKKVEIFGITNSCNLAQLLEIFPLARQFIVLFTTYPDWEDLEDYASSLREHRPAQVNTIMLEKCRFLGYICLDQYIVVGNHPEFLPIDLSSHDFQPLQQSLDDHLSYHCCAPEEKFAKPDLPLPLQMLTNDQVQWLTQQYLNVCAGDRFCLDRHGYIELITSLDGTPAYFYPPYGDVEEVSAGRHKIDLILEEILRRLKQCGQTEKMPNELIINQIICLGTRRNTTHETGSHWIVRSVRLSGLNPAQLAASDINGLYDDCTLSYLNSADNHTSHGFENCINKILKCVAKKVTAIDIVVPNQFEMGSHLQRGVICGDLAVQNAVSFTIYGCVPAAKQYTTRDEHITWVKQNHPVIGQQIRWNFDLSKTLAETLNVTKEINLLNTCESLDEANQLIAKIRGKISAFIQTEAIAFYHKNNTFWASLNFLAHKSRTVQLDSLVALQSLVDAPATAEKITPLALQEAEMHMPKWNTAHYSEKSKLLFDSVRLIEAIIARNLDRLNVVLPLTNHF